MLTEHKKSDTMNMREAVKLQRRKMLDEMTLGAISAYLLWRYRVFLLSAGYPVITTLVLVLHYR